MLHAFSLQVSFLTAAQYAAWIAIGLLAGVIVQRLPLRGTQVAMDLIRAGTVLSVPVVPRSVPCTWPIWCWGPGDRPGDRDLRRGHLDLPAVDRQQGGADGPRSPWYVVSYLVSAVLLRRLPQPAPVRRRAKIESMMTLIREGWRFVAHPG
ncbi:hypothetical protein [Streptomyces malaysiensis]|uniref:hypothetical protein n=1 Tax=Streptomyces malaysiensis TaxID=92644 RepID=UPI00163D743F|nr:hypothetical protein [Streptomyces malaysiensis]